MIARCGESRRTRWIDDSADLSGLARLPGDSGAAARPADGLRPGAAGPARAAQPLPERLALPPRAHPGGVPGSGGAVRAAPRRARRRLGTALRRPARGTQPAVRERGAGGHRARVVRAPRSLPLLQRPAGAARRHRRGGTVPCPGPTAVSGAAAATPGRVFRRRTFRPGRIGQRPVAASGGAERVHVAADSITDRSTDQGVLAGAGGESPGLAVLVPRNRVPGHGPRAPVLRRPRTGQPRGVVVGRRAAGGRAGLAVGPGAAAGDVLPSRRAASCRRLRELSQAGMAGGPGPDRGRQPIHRPSHRGAIEGMRFSA